MMRVRQAGRMSRPNYDIHAKLSRRVSNWNSITSFSEIA